MGDNHKVPMTREGYEALQRELSHLKGVIRPKVIEEIRQAREFGDLSENAEYHAAKEKQALTQAKIHQLEDRLSRAQIIDSRNLDGGGKVVFGAVVKVMDLETEEEKVFRLVGQDEADVQKGKISIMSPVARALIGKEVDDEIEVRVPKGVIRYQILEIGSE
ncbi:MAG: transcription elongation factor GreA [Candidatus Tectomicrobia bacterium]|uniref:Transcription elongation factor GreA n=1 Tax=Tectimicrobiota bacterium TaxID=2528274 RepID=A0A932CMC2_UNCTE|nr:transcription elongation factor GreA [Candidatus Tectomicrobia bacterium]